MTTLHTILAEPDSDQRKVLDEIARLSDRLVVMSATGARFLQEIYGVPEDKIDIIPHGIPDVPFVDPNFYKDQFGVEGKIVLLTFGLLSPNKGIETVIDALPEVLGRYPHVVYVVLAATHPHIRQREGESYRLSLERLAAKRGVEKNVIFHNRFVSLEELNEFIGAADIYLTPYLSPAQIVSGTLAYVVAPERRLFPHPIGTPGNYFPKAAACFFLLAMRMRLQARLLPCWTRTVNGMPCASAPIGGAGR